MAVPSRVFGIIRPTKGARGGNGHFREGGGFRGVNAPPRFHPMPIAEDPQAPRDGANTKTHIHDAHGLPLWRMGGAEQQDFPLRLGHGLVQYGAIQ